MRPSDAGQFNIGTRLTATFALLIVLILGGNGLVLWQFSLARTQTDRLTGANQQAMVVLQLQVSLLSFHQRLDELARWRDFRELAAEAEPLRRALYEQTRRTRSALSSLQAVTPVQPAFWPTLEAAEVILPEQLDTITELARAGDWEAVQLRLGKQLAPIESQTGILVDSVDRQANQELAQAVDQMRAIQRRILILVPSTALCSFIVAAWFGWSIARRFIELRTEERVTERMRIARELHDTLLQSFQGLLFELQAARNLFARRPEDAIRTLDGAIGSAEAAIAEGRDAIQDLRVGSDVRSDLAHLLRATGKELSDAQAPDGSLAAFRLTVEGSPQTLSPVLQDEIYRIGREILRNAFHHARATKIETEIRYDDRMLRLRIRDDGIGVDPKVLGEGARPGHWGLSGIRERANVVGAKLDLWSEEGAGTEVEVTVPAAIAYAKTREVRASRWLRKTARSHGD